MNENNSKLSSRRNFLLSVGAGGAATAAALVAKTKPVTGVSVRAARDARGYQDTSHVRNYYRTTKV